MDQIRRYGPALLLLVVFMALGKQHSNACVTKNDFILPQAECLTSECDTDCIQFNGGIAGNARSVAPQLFPYAFNVAYHFFLYAEYVRPNTFPTMSPMKIGRAHV